MSFQTHTPGEWLTVLGLSTGATVLWFAPVLAMDHEPPDFAEIAAKCKRGVQLAAAEVARDVLRLRVTVVALLLVIVAHLDPSPSSAPKKGAHHA